MEPGVKEKSNFERSSKVVVSWGILEGKVRKREHWEKRLVTEFWSACTVEGLRATFSQMKSWERFHVN